MRMANKTNVNANKEAETVEEVKAVDDEIGRASCRERVYRGV